MLAGAVQVFVLWLTTDAGLVSVVQVEPGLPEELLQMLTVDMAVVGKFAIAPSTSDSA